MTTDNRFDFHSMLAWSNEQEKHFAENIYKKHKLLPPEDRTHDFLTPRGLKVELKSDTYDMNKSGNFFMEKYSNMYKKTPGGIWRAEADGIDIFIYHFVNNKVYYEFRDLKKVVKFLTKLTDNDYMVSIPNKGYYTGGYKVPRDLLADYYTRVTYK
jgi:hypothetical protein